MLGKVWYHTLPLVLSGLVGNSRLGAVKTTDSGDDAPNDQTMMMVQGRQLMVMTKKSCSVSCCRRDV